MESLVLPVITVAAVVIGIAVLLYLGWIRWSYIREGRLVAEKTAERARMREEILRAQGLEARENIVSEGEGLTDLEDVPISAIASDDGARSELLKRLSKGIPAHRTTPPTSGPLSGRRRARRKSEEEEEEETPS